MRVTVVDTAADSGGALSILMDFYRYVLQHGQAHRWTFVLGAAALPDAPHITVLRYPGAKRSWAARLAFDVLTLPRVVADTRPDAVLSLQNLAVLRQRVPQVIYMHQPLPFVTDIKRYALWRRGETRYALYQRVYGGLMARSARAAVFCVAQTRYMADALAQRAGIAPERVRKIAPSIDIPSGQPPAIADGETVRTRRFLYPAAYYPYKNHTCAVQAARLLLAGGTADFEIVFTLPPGLRPVLGAEDLPCVRFSGPIPRDELLRQMRESALLFPSYIESYGMPVAEARALGSPVLAADTGFSRELLAGYPNARFFDPFSPQAMADAMAAVLTGKMAYRTESPQERAESASAWARVVGLLEEAAVKIGLSR
ncbi:MAG: glycosyltransferase [Oscillospiraceae bacterium]|jgi:glycosyltransferase involved in cell wall biosynthesis|nr:glycosyltransferase [Oscillospiraceae bacterium]